MLDTQRDVELTNHWWKESYTQMSLSKSRKNNISKSTAVVKYCAVRIEIFLKQNNIRVNRSFGQRAVNMDTWGLIHVKKPVLRFASNRSSIRQGNISAMQDI